MLEKEWDFKFKKKGGGSSGRELLVLGVILIMYKWSEFKIRYLIITLEVNLINIYKLNYTQQNHSDYVKNIIW